VPEGDTVWRAARSLDRALAGHVLTGTDFRVPQLATVDLTGGRLRQTVSRGKHLLTHIDHGGAHWTLHTHLKMEGSWHIYQHGQRWRRPAHEARVILETAERVCVGFALGIVELLPRAEEDRAVGHLGPDLLGDDWDLEEAVKRLSQQPTRAVGEALLDQRNLAGIGNIYRNELCFLAGVRPTAPLRAVADLPRLVKRAKALLEANKERVEQTTTGDLGKGRRSWVYRQRTCRRCGTRVVVAQDDRARAMYWCPSCQPA
jgi:endonuclease VIII